MDIDRFLTRSLTDMRVARILQSALDAVEPGRIVQGFLNRTQLPAHERVFLLGIGKAAEPMVVAATSSLPEFSKAIAITKRASGMERDRILVMEAGHPIPDARSVMAGQAAIKFVSELGEKDLLVCLISGGGSALVTSPRTGVGLRDIQLITTALLQAGASIGEINTIRRHLDSIKGGGLARATKAHVISLLLSDVVGDQLESIASGPTAPDPTTGADALTTLNRYHIQIPPHVYSVLSTQPTPVDLPKTRVTNHIVGSNDLAGQAALEQAEREGFAANILRTDIQGEARLVGQRLAERLNRDIADVSRPFCLIAGGETTVTIRGAGKGGRNQELALAAVDVLAGSSNAMLISMATDGDDGPTDAAGAVVTGETRERARSLGLDVQKYLDANNSYAFFDALSDLLRPGYSGTNVNDLMLLFAF